MTSRVIEISIGLSWPLRVIVSLTAVLHRAAHLLDRLIEAEPLDQFAVELRDHVVGQYAGLGGGGVVDRGHDLDLAVLHGDFHAEAPELALRLHLHVAEIVGVHVARMRIEARQHAVDRGCDQLGVVGLVDIVGAHLLEDVAEQLELAVGLLARGRGGRCGGVGDEPEGDGRRLRRPAAPRRIPRRRRAEPTPSCAGAACLCEPPRPRTDRPARPAPLDLSPKNLSPNDEINAGPSADAPHNAVIYSGSRRAANAQKRRNRSRLRETASSGPAGTELAAGPNCRGMAPCRRPARGRRHPPAPHRALPSGPPRVANCTGQSYKATWQWLANAYFAMQ